MWAEFIIKTKTGKIIDSIENCFFDNIMNLNTNTEAGIAILREFG